MTEIIADFSARGIRLWTNGDLLQYRGPITPEDIDTLRRHKAEILAEIRQPESDFDFLAAELASDDLAQLLADRDAGEAGGLDRAAAEAEAVREWIQKYRAERGRK